jgi:membrane protein DedA with SNARE-associated domain
MTDIVSPLLQWLNNHPHLAGLVTFTISAAESVAIIGTIVPGSIMMTALGTLAGAGIIPLWSTIFWAIMGAIVGDGISYWIGHHFKHHLVDVWPFRKHPNLLISGERFLHKYGSMSVFIGRFVGPVRALVPLVAGMLGMKPLQFTIANVSSAIGWAPAYMLPGIMLGAASQELPPDIATHFILVFLLGSMFVLLCLWFIYKILQLLTEQTNQLLNRIWSRLKRSRILSPITILLKHYNPHKKHGQLSLGLFFIATSLLFLALAYYVKQHGAANIMANDVVFHFFRSLRDAHIDSIMISITLLGQKQVILPVVIVVCALLVYLRRWRVAFHALALAVIAAGSVYVMKHILMSERPWGILQSPETYSMPSGHTTLATTLFLGLSFLISRSFRPKNRWPLYLFAVLIALSVGVSRLYLGAHWFTDVLSAWLLSTAVLTFVIILYQRQKIKKVPALKITLVSFLTLAIMFGFYHHKHDVQLHTMYTQVDYPTTTITTKEWWEKNSMMATYHASLFGFPSQPINIEWSGDLEKIKETLTKEGWIKPPVRDLISTIHRLADISSTQYLPLISPQYLDSKPALILTRNANGEKGLLVIRLWNANRLLNEANTPIWVGIVEMVPRSYSWLFRERRIKLPVDALNIFPSKTAAHLWEWKTITLPEKQKIILIRQKNRKK